ncbi:MAG: excinuclease ABC subunit UvrA [Thermosulfidibacteraceae bacterium]
MVDRIIIKGARQHNLKNIDLEIPKNKLVVITGVSGSGKSSLAFDTIYAEGYRRYVESLSSYARQFLEIMEKPDVDAIYGLTPSIAIDQRSLSTNPRSIIATVTEIYDYLRLLFARCGDLICPNCGVPVEGRTAQEIAQIVISGFSGEKVMILSPIITGRKGEFKDIFLKLRKEGFVRVRVDGIFYRLDEDIPLDKNKKHTIEAVVDRVKVVKDEKSRIVDSIEIALKLSNGIVKVLVGDREYLYSENFSCPQCSFSLGEISPRIFSFNSPYGACPKCKGIGYEATIDPYLAIREDLSIEEGAIIPWRDSDYWSDILLSFCKAYDIPVDVPFKDLLEEQKKLIVEGTIEPVELTFRYKGERNFIGSYDGLRFYLRRRLENGDETAYQYIVKKVCDVCGGSRLRRESLAVKIEGRSIWDVVRMSVDEAYMFFKELSFKGVKAEIAGKILKEIISRLSFLKEVGVGYLTLDREVATLSGGEAQRVRLATQIGVGLSGVTYVLDEPTIGLHPRDVERLVNNLKRIRDLGNTVIVVEHEKLVIEEADYIVDLGPEAGERGGYLVYAGEPSGILNAKDSITGAYLSGRCEIVIPEKRREPKGYIKFFGVTHRNLKNIDVEIPLGTFVCVTGVSGSGKSSLICEVVYPAIYNRLYRGKLQEGAYRRFEGVEGIDRVIFVDQSPIGRTPRSNPATYIGLFTHIRELFAEMPLAKARGYKPGRFSFNVKGGRCEKCKGEGAIKVEMHFMPDVYVTCPECKGKRYSEETLQVTFKGKNIADILNMTVDEAVNFFENQPQILAKLTVLKQVGLGYIRLGQPATTLSGGEAQRIKLARELSKRATGNTLYIMDEPTVGLHMEDVKKLIGVLHMLVDRGNTVVVIEHNLDVIKNADFVIDLGPEGGNDGGYVVAYGRPEDVALKEESYTGRFLRSVIYSSVGKM